MSRFRIAVCCVILAACSPAGGPLSEAQRTAIEMSADSATRSFLDGELAQDAERTIAHLAPDFYMYNDGKRIGYDSVAASIRATMGAFQHFESQWREIEARAVGPDAALVTFVFYDSIVMATGETLLLKGPTTLVWERRGDDWLITYADADHYPATEP